MSSLWIVHREPASRAALARLAAARAESVAGAPGEARFDAAPEPDVVVLGLAGDLEAELEFAHRMAPRLRRSGWVLVGESARLAAAERLFDALPARRLRYPPEPARLREAIREAHLAPVPLPLSQRPVRDALAERFARGFADLEIHGLLRALDPRLRRVPVLVRGEPGTGRGTLARYVHHFGAGAGGLLVELPCTGSTRAEELLEAIAAAGRDPRSRLACTLWLEDAERLPAALQRRVQGWVELGPGTGGPPPAALRWVATTTPEGPEPGLARALGVLALDVPPLRERPGAIANLANATAHAWCTAQGLAPRRLGEDALAELERYPWPGNLRELEAVVEQSLAASAADPLHPEHLILGGEPFAAADGAAYDLGPAERAPAAGPEEPEIADAVERLVEAESRREAGPEGPPPAAEAQLAEEPWEAESGEKEEEEEPPPPGPRGPDLVRLAGALGHELRNPLTAVRTYSELLPERHGDPDFRERFGALTRESLARVERVLDRLERLGAFGAPQPRRVEVGRLLEELLEARRGRIRQRRLVVLEELDRAAVARADPAQLRFALEALLDRALELVPERGDVYVAARRHEAGARGEPGVRVLVRFRSAAGAPGARRRPDTDPATQALELAIAELVVRAQGGASTLDTADPNETIVVMDLPGL